MYFDSLVFPGSRPKNLERVQPYLDFVAYEVGSKSPDPTELAQLGCCSNARATNYHIPILKELREGRPLLLYLHANGEDMITSLDFIVETCKENQMGFVIMEYPGYSLYRKYEQKPVHQIVEEDSVRVFDHFQKLGYEIVLFGRSIGTGVALWLATARTPLAMVLLSPFSTLRSLVEEKFGWLAGRLLEERFENVGRAGRVQCRSLVVHGMADEVVPMQQGIEVFNRLQCEKELILVKDMTHSRIDFRVFLFVLSKFLARRD